jgi:hypothetical protein
MPKHSGSGGTHHTTRQKGTANRHRSGAGTYARMGKGRYADRYDRPYTDGTYRSWKRYNHETDSMELIHPDDW